MNLLYLSHGYTTHDRRYLTSLAEAGWRVSFLPLTNERLEDRPAPRTVHPLSWREGERSFRSPTDYIPRLLALRRILKAVGPQIVLAGPIQTAAFLVTLTGYRPLVAMSWGSDLLVDAGRSPAMRWITRFTLRRSAGALGDCQAVRHKIRAFGNLPDDRIVTFPWGIDLAMFDPRTPSLSLRENLGWTKSAVLISTRTWEPRYAIDVLVRAFGLLRRGRPGARLLLLGDGSEAPAIHRLIAKLRLGDIIHTPGRIGNDLLPDYLRSADLYVSTALSDGTSISLLEAMACGLPAVVANDHGNLEWVTPGTNGWLAPPGDPVALARILDEALADAQRLVTIGMANAALARSRADWPKNFAALLELFERILMARRGSPAAGLQESPLRLPSTSRTGRRT